MNKIFQRMGDSRFFIVFLLTFVNGLSMTMLFPVLPFVIKLYSQPEVFLGILFGTFSFFQFVAAPILWALSDKYGRKPILILTQAGTLLSWIVLWIASRLPETTIFGFLLLPIFVIFLSRVFDGITWGNASVAQAMIADLTKPEERSKIFGVNGAVFGLSMLIGPALGSLSMTGNIWYFGTAITWAFFSIVTLVIMIFFLTESLKKDKCAKYVKISFSQFNIVSQLKKWGKLPMVRYVLIIKLFMFTAFVWYTSISTLYLIDVFGFSADKVGYYLTFTGSFIIFHQSLSIRFFIQRFWDRGSLQCALLFLGLGYIMMWLSAHIIIFTVFYFFAVLGIALSFTTMWSLISRSVDESHQWEVMWLSTSVESFISIGVPIVATYVYGVLDISIYLLIAVLPLLAFIISYMMCPNIQLKERKNS